jgi:hypothetical protein
MFAKRSLLALGLALMQVSIATADEIAGVCNNIVKNALTEFSIREDSSASLDVIYDDACSGGSVREGARLSSSLDAIVDAVPVKFKAMLRQTKK